jgi:hypothetical protein
VSMAESRFTYPILLVAGAVLLFLSTIFVSSIFAFIGLGLIFWGLIFPYIRTEEYARKSLLDSTLHSQSALLNQMFKRLQYEGKAVYLPPKYFADSDTVRVFVPMEKDLSQISELANMQEHEVDSSVDASGFLLIPPGAELAKLFERILGTNFTRMNLKNIKSKISELLVDELEIAGKIEMRILNNDVFLKLENYRFYSLIEEAEPELALGSILSSAIACAITKASGNPLRIEKQQISEIDHCLILNYRLLGVGV